MLAALAAPSRRRGRDRRRRDPELRAALRAPAGDVLHAGRRDGDDRLDVRGEAELGAHAGRARARPREDHQAGARAKAEGRPSFDFGKANETDAAFTKTAVAMEDLTVALLAGVTPQVRDTGARRRAVRPADRRGAPRRMGAAHRRVGARAARLRRADDAHQVQGAIARTRFVVQRPRTSGTRAPFHGLMARRAAALCAATVAATVAVLAAGTGADARAAPVRPRPSAPSRRRWRPPSRPGRRAGSAPGRHRSLWAPVQAATAAVRSAPGRRRARGGDARADDAGGHAQRRRGRRARRGPPRAPVGARSGSPCSPTAPPDGSRAHALGGYGTVLTRLVVDIERAHGDALPARAGRCSARRSASERPPRRRPRESSTSATGSPAIAARRTARSRSAPARAPRQATDWPAGGFVGIHGTDRPDLVPGRVSHGCIRFRNADILALARRMPVGTPVTIR